LLVEMAVLRFTQFNIGKNWNRAESEEIADFLIFLENVSAYFL